MKFISDSFFFLFNTISFSHSFFFGNLIQNLFSIYLFNILNSNVNLWWRWSRTTNRSTSSTNTEPIHTKWWTRICWSSTEHYCFGKSWRQISLCGQQSRYLSGKLHPTFSVTFICFRILYNFIYICFLYTIYISKILAQYCFRPIWSFDVTKKRKKERICSSSFVPNFLLIFFHILIHCLVRQFWYLLRTGG